MFRLATAPSIANLRRPRLAALPAVKSTTTTSVVTAPTATADIRIRRFGTSDVREDTYSAILPGEGLSPAELLRTITDAFQGVPEFEVRDKADERFILTLTLKG